MNFKKQMKSKIVEKNIFFEKVCERRKNYAIFALTKKEEDLYKKADVV